MVRLGARAVVLSGHQAALRTGLLMLLLAPSSVPAWLDLQPDASAPAIYRSSLLAGESRSWQFTRAAAYPDDDYVSSLAKQLPPDWQACALTVDGWERYRIDAGGRLQQTFRRRAVWRSPNARRALALSLSYQQDKCPARTCVPTAAQVHVTVVENRAPAWLPWLDYDLICPTVKAQAR